MKIESQITLNIWTFTFIFDLDIRVIATSITWRHFYTTLIVIFSFAVETNSIKYVYLFSFVVNPDIFLKKICLFLN